MEKRYKEIDWSQFPKNLTDMGDTNMNHLDSELFDIDSRIIEKEGEQQNG